MIIMTMYKEGYRFYCEMCENFGIDAIPFRYYVLQLSKEQLTAYNRQALASTI